MRPAEGEVDGATGATELETTTQDGVNRDTPIGASADESISAPSKPRITLTFGGRKRKAEDDATTASPELHTPPSHTSKTPEVDATAATTEPSSGPVPAIETTSGDKHANSNNTAASAPSKDAPNSSGSTNGTDRAPVVATPAVTQLIDTTKRAPRKRRKWLRKGEVDPDDHKAVAEQRARHALIDAALEALDKQEQALLDGTHPQLLELWDEIKRRHELQMSYCKYHEECEMRELDKLYLQELGQIRRQFKVSSIG